MAIRIYFDPVKLVKNPEFQTIRAGSGPHPEKPESWEGCGTVTIRGIRLRWDFDSHGLPYVNLEGMLNGEALPEILEIFSQKTFLESAGYKFSSMKESWEGNAIPDQEIAFKDRDLKTVCATANVRRDAQRTNMELITRELPYSCIHFYRCIRENRKTPPLFDMESNLYEK